MQTSTVVAGLVRGVALVSGYLGILFLSTLVQDESTNATDIGGGLLMLGLAMSAGTVWAVLDAWRHPLEECLARWMLAGATIALAIAALVVVRGDTAGLLDVVLLPVVLAGLITAPALLSAAVTAGLRRAPSPETSPGQRPS